MTDETPSEKTQAKAAEYLLAGRVRVTSLIPGGQSCEAEVYSANQDGDPYRVRFNNSGWHCDCPARVQLCAHILAVQTVTDLKVDKSAAMSFTPKTDVSIDEILGGL